MNTIAILNNELWFQNEIEKYPLISKEEEKELAIKYKEENCLESAQTLVTSHLRYVVAMATDFHMKYHLDKKDLIQEGAIGLMIAVKKFDPHNGNRLLSYAKHWIISMMQKFVIRNKSIVSSFTRKKRSELFYKSDSSYTDNDVSMDENFGDEINSFHEILVDDRENPEEIMLKKSQKDVILDVLNDTNEKDRFVIENRLMTDEPLTFQEIGTELNITREGARQLTQRISNRLAKKLQNLS